MNRTWLGLFSSLAFGAAACASSPKPSPAPRVDKPAPAAADKTAPPPRTSETGSAVGAEQAAMRFFEAMMKGDKAGMKAVMLTYAELADISKNAPAQQEYELELEEFLDGRAREGKDAPPGTRLERVEVERSEVLKAAESEKLKHDLAIAIVHPVFTLNGEARSSMGILFVKTPAGFKLSIRN